MLFRYQLISIATILFVFSFTACSDNSTGASDEPVAIINGSVEGETSQSKVNSTAKNEDGTVISAARITSNGSFETISGTETETDASGQFSLEVDVNAAEQLVIIAEQSSGELKGFISAEIENGQSYDLKPLNGESTAETSIFAEIVANGNADIVQKSDIEAVIQSETAARVNASSDAAAKLAAGLENYADARAKFFAEFVEGSTETSLTQAFELMASAQFEYEASLQASSSSENKEAALESLLEATLNAYAEAGVETSAKAKLVHMQTTALQNSIASTSGEIKENVTSSASLFAAIALDSSTRASAEASGFSDATVSAIADAGVTLKNEIKASAGSSSEIEASFEAYHEDVRSAMENDSSTEASIIIEIDTEINAAAGPKFTFENALSGVVSAELLTDITSTFESSIQNSVEARSDQLGDLNTEAVADLFVLINLF